MTNISKKMSAMLPREMMGLIKRIGILANSIDYRAFVVGGMVRDLLLGRKNLDLDIVVEGDAIKLGTILARELKGSLVMHRKFGTCTVVTSKRFKIDLATARKEVYEAPAALPTVVEFGSLKNDLMRRDFTINAMAVSINKDDFGELIDFFDGKKDLARGRIAVMHDASFIDDPTRIFRAVRFEQRFNFTIDSHTEKLILNALDKDMVEKVHPHRLRDEIELILKEKEPLKAIRRMSNLHEYRFIHPGIRFDKKLSRFCRDIERTALWYERSHFGKRPLEKWLMLLAALFEDLNYNQTKALCGKYAFRRGDTIRLLSYKKDGDRVIRELEKKAISPSKIYRLLEPLSYEVTLLIMAKSRSRAARARIKVFLKKYNGTRISIRGGDLKKLGFKPGPDFRRIMEKVLYKKIDGVLKTRRDELNCVRRLAKHDGA